MKGVWIFTLLLGWGFSDWIDQRVESELAHIPKKSIKRSQIAAAARGEEGVTLYAEAAHIIIEGGRARVESFLTTGDWAAAERLKSLVRHINLWQKSAKARPSRKLPDTEFILSLSEGIEAHWQSNYVDITRYGVPVFTFAKKRGSKQLILFPDTRALAKKTCRDPLSWNRKEERLFWQGRGSDGFYTKGAWRTNPRAHLVLLARKRPDLIEAHFTGYLQYCDRAAFDEILRAVGPLQIAQSPRDFFRYKYLLDLEGASLSWSEISLALSSNSLLFKQSSDFIQWYSDELKPALHFIAVAHDLSDLERQIAWAKENDHRAQAIAQAGQKCSQELFKRATTFEYIQRLLRAYNERLVP